MARQDRNFENRPSERYGNQRREGREGGYGMSSGFDQPGYQGGFGQPGGYRSPGGQYGFGAGYGYGPTYGGYGYPQGAGEAMPGYGYGRGPQQREQYGSIGQQGYENIWGSTGLGYGSGFGLGGPGFGQGTQQRGSYVGRGPRNYRRTDDRIQEEINELLTRNPEIDAYEIEVTVQGGEVILAGFVDDRRAKRLAEDIAEECSGVNEVRNNIRVRGQQPNRELKGGSSSPEAQSQGRAQSEGRSPAESRSRSGSRR